MASMRRPLGSGLIGLLLLPLCLDPALAAEQRRTAHAVAPPPLPVPNPKRQRQTAHSGTPALKVGFHAPQAELPPLPAANPLRVISTARQTPTFAPADGFTPPLPSRGSVVADRVLALAPLLQMDVSKSDIDLLRASVDDILRKRTAEAAAKRRAIADPVVRKLALWAQYRRAADWPDPMQIEKFRRDNPDWPSRTLLRRNAERSMYKQNAEPASVMALYGSNMPRTGLGMFLLARAHKQSGKEAEAVKLARTLWRSQALGETTEVEFLAEFGNLLRREDHLRRADHFLYQDRRRLLPIVRRVVKLLDKPDQERLNLRIEVVKRRHAVAEAGYAKLGSKALKDTGLLFNRIQLLRRQKNFTAAWALLNRAPSDAKGMVEPGEWWIERRVQVRYALAEGNPGAAYKIASQHGEIPQDDLVEAEFMAGWIALTRLKRPAAAAKHFELMSKAASEDQDVAKAAYWLGRALRTSGDRIGALSHFAAASKHPRTFYGQLALQKVERTGALADLAPASPTSLDLERFMNRDAVKALIISHKAQLTNLTPLFFSHLAWRLDSPGEMTLLAELASQIHSQRGSVITGKIGIHRGFNLDRYAYPINALPPYDRLTAEVEPAFLLALARQESEFNAAARSHAGARGMMQIMPGTARQIARNHNVTYSRSRLISDPSYNVTLGVAHIHDLIQKYNGSYLLTLVAYNAGPGRVRDWIEAYGDPRSRGVDPVDWIETIPFSETRRYVQRILSSAQIFRHRLRNEKGRIRLAQDLRRGHPDAVKKSGLDDLVEKIAAGR